MSKDDMEVEHEVGRNQEDPSPTPPPPLCLMRRRKYFLENNNRQGKKMKILAKMARINNIPLDNILRSSMIDGRAARARQQENSIAGEYEVTKIWTARHGRKVLNGREAVSTFLSPTFQISFTHQWRSGHFSDFLSFFGH